MPLMQMYTTSHSRTPIWDSLSVIGYQVIVIGCSLTVMTVRQSSVIGRLLTETLVVRLPSLSDCFQNYEFPLTVIDHCVSAMLIYTVVSRGGQGAISSPKIINGTRGHDEHLKN